MKIEIVSIGTELLESDILDTNSAYISRCLREIDVSITTKVTVGDDLEMIKDVLQIALKRADAVLTSGGMGDGDNDFTREAIRELINHEFNLNDEAPDYQVIGDEDQYGSGVMVKILNGELIALPGNRKELAYLLETDVLPHLREQATAVSKVSNWVLLRTVGVMESSIKQELGDIATGPNHRITYDSFAGQTNIRIWVEHVTNELVQQELNRIQDIVTERLGDHIFGSEKDVLERVVMNKLTEDDYTLALGECCTEGILSKALEQLPEIKDRVKLFPVDDWKTLSEKLNISDLEDEQLVHWCREAAQALVTKEKTDIGLLIFTDVNQGGIQILVTLASEQGVSITQRSFGGHPENIHQWALTLGLSHLRRWLINRDS